MGGKDAIIVDADADIDAAVEGVAQAAFGFQGQKCSACSRAIVDERIYDNFLQQFKARVEKITVGDPAENTNMGAVINEGSMKTILGYIEQGKKDGRLITGGERASAGGEGYYIQPTVIADIPAKSKLEQEEIFGPVLAVIKARGFRSRARNRERYRVRPYRRGLHPIARQDRTLHSRLPCGQSVHQPKMHRRNGWRASFRRIQYVGNGFEIRRAGLSISVYAGEIGGRKSLV